MLRLDPDYLLIGEVRGEDSARAAIDAAVSGRVLLSTLHSRDAVGAITSLRNWGLADFEIATVVSTVVGQRLVRKLCTNCREKRAPTDKQKRWLQNMELDVPHEVFAANGCDECDNLGYLGRTGVFEVWQLGENDWDAIREHTHERAIRDQLARDGHQFMLSDALAKAEEGITDLDEVRSLAGLRPAIHAAPLQSQKAQSA
jgi:general secretion pathway protein E